MSAKRKCPWCGKIEKKPKGDTEWVAGEDPTCQFCGGSFTERLGKRVS